jgi:phosphatidylglycerophosphate synthase
MLIAAVVSYAFADARPVALVGACALAGFASKNVTVGKFGAANAVTTVRVVLVLLLASIERLGPLSALLVAAVLGLDALDGALARRFGTASPFGAAFDMETDALLVLVAGIRLATSGRLPPWIVLPGLYRYAYAAALVVLPHAAGEAPRSRLGQYGFVAIAASSAVSAYPIPVVHVPLAALATALVTYSFARSTLWSFGRRNGKASSAAPSERGLSVDREELPLYSAGGPRPANPSRTPP